VSEIENPPQPSHYINWAVPALFYNNKVTEIPIHKVCIARNVPLESFPTLCGSIQLRLSSPTKYCSNSCFQSSWTLLPTYLSLQHCLCPVFIPPIRDNESNYCRILIIRNVSLLYFLNSLIKYCSVIIHYVIYSHWNSQAFYICLLFNQIFSSSRKILKRPLRLQLVSVLSFTVPDLTKFQFVHCFISQIRIWLLLVDLTCNSRSWRVATYVLRVILVVPDWLSQLPERTQGTWNLCYSSLIKPTFFFLNLSEHMRWSNIYTSKHSGKYMYHLH
jgi:hypothetical protein